MTKLTTPANTADVTAVPLVRIEAQHETYIIPLREYLEANGCSVIINTRTDNPVAYHIVCGDFLFVKHIFSLSSNHGAKRFGIITGSDAPNAPDAFDKHTKIIVTDAQKLHAQDVVDFFSFFFTGDGLFLDKRRNIHEAHTPETLRTHEPVQPEAPKKILHQEHATPKEDRERIGNILTDVFGADEKRLKKPKKEHGRKRVRRYAGNILKRTGLVILICTIPFLWYAVSVFFTGASVAQQIRAIQKGNTSEALRYGSLGTYWLYQGRLSLSVLKIPFVLLGNEKSVRGQERLLSLFSDTATVLHETSYMMKTHSETIQMLLIPQGNAGLDRHRSRS